LIAAEIFFDIFQIARAVQMFVLGPRLILSIRDYQAKLVTNSDEGTVMTTECPAGSLTPECTFEDHSEEIPALSSVMVVTRRSS